MSYTYCTSAAIIIKAGANVNSTATGSNIIIKQFCDNAEGYLNVATRYDWTAASAAITASYPNYKPMIADVISSLAAIDMINYDMESIGRNEAQARINVLYDRATTGINYIKQLKRPELEI